MSANPTTLPVPYSASAVQGPEHVQAVQSVHADPSTQAMLGPLAQANA